MTIRRLLVFIIGVFLVAGISMAQGPKKDVGKNVPLPSGSTDQKAPPKSDQQQPPQVPSLSIDVDLMSFDVVVTDQGGNPISGLEKKHFRVFDDDVEQNVTNFSPADAPLTVVVLAEFSDTFGYYFDDVVGPAAGFINSLRKDDWAALIAFDIRPEILTDFTKNKAELFDGLRRMRIPAYRETCLYDAVYDTLQRLDRVDGKKSIFLLSTGLDTNISKHTYGEALKKAETSDTMIYSRDVRHDDLRGFHGTVGSVVFRVAAFGPGPNYISSGRQCHALSRRSDRRRGFLSTIRRRVSQHLSSSRSESPK